MGNMNFTQKLFNAGFERVVGEHEKKGRYDAAFTPLNGWLGVVVYHPFEMFIKGNKKVELSLERYGVVETIVGSNGITTHNRVDEKHIKLLIGDEIIYSNNFGVLPPKDLCEQFLK